MAKQPTWGKSGRYGVVGKKWMRRHGPCERCRQPRDMRYPTCARCAGVA
jgi:hypothetical protein